MTKRFWKPGQVTVAVSTADAATTANMMIMVYGLAKIMRCLSDPAAKQKHTRKTRCTIVHIIPSHSTWDHTQCDS
jgi:hypothetical protein